MQLKWLIRRLSRISPEEIPYRVGGVVRAKLQKSGFLDARRVPAKAVDASGGNSWVQVPHRRHLHSDAIFRIADRLINELDIFDTKVSFVDGQPAWNVDPKTGRDIGQEFGLSIDFRHIAGGVDIKYLWELNRHIWWVPIAQAYAIAKDGKYLHAIGRLLKSWLEQCQYPKGANWSSPVEHGVRLINWSIVWHLIGGEQSPLFTDEEGRHLRERWTDSVYQHMRFASDNYSLYSSADNHLIGEAAGIFVAGHTWNYWTTGRQMRDASKEILEREIIKQFSAQGVNTEQALCYQKFSMEFLLASMLAGEANHDSFSAPFKQRFGSALSFLAAIMDCKGRPPHIGDSDDGKVFEFACTGFNSNYEMQLAVGGLAVSSTAALRKLQLLNRECDPSMLWLFLPESNEAKSDELCQLDLTKSLCTDSYLIFGKDLQEDNEFRLVFDVGPLGSNKIAGHGHADALSLLLQVSGVDFLVDSGTFCYNASPAYRHYFRSTRAHNTVVVDGQDQSIYGGSFLWLRDVETTVHSLTDNGVTLTVNASHSGYLALKDPVRHFRTVIFNRRDLTVVVEDRFECSQPHLAEFHWHFSPECAVSGVGTKWVIRRDVGTLQVESPSESLKSIIEVAGEDPPVGWYSDSFYVKRPAPVLISKGYIRSGEVYITKLSYTPSLEIAASLRS